MTNGPLLAASLVLPVHEVLMIAKLVAWLNPAGYSHPCSVKPQAQPEVGENTKGLREHKTRLRSTCRSAARLPKAAYITHIQRPSQHPLTPSSAISHPLCSWGPWQGPWAAGICSLKRYLSFHLLRAKESHKRTCPMSGAQALHRDRCSHVHEAVNCRHCPCRRTWGPAVQEVSGRPQT